MGTIFMIMLALSGIAWLVHDVQAKLEHNAYIKHYND